MFFAQEFAPDGSVSLSCSVIQGSTKLQNLRRNPRVAFAVSPSLPTRWVQGLATAQILADPAEARRALDLLVARSPAARDFIDRLPVSTVRLSVRSVKLADITGPRPDRAAVGFSQGCP